jgi:hypothetical protein
LSLSLVGILLFCFLLDGVHVNLAQVLALVQKLVESVWGMDRVVFLRGVLSSILKDDLWTARVFGEEFCHIVGASVDNDPA